MEHFVRVVMEKQKSMKIDESIFPNQTLYETDNGDDVIEMPLPRNLDEDEADEFANKLAEMMFEAGYNEFDIEISKDNE